VNYGEELLDSAFIAQRNSLLRALGSLWFTWDFLLLPGGNEAPVTRLIRRALTDEGWTPRTFEVAVLLNGVPTVGRSHAVDHFQDGTAAQYPGVAAETEWNNKDEFFDRDLINFEALHGARGMAVGLMIVRGADLNAELVRRDALVGRTSRYGARTTHWQKLMDRLDLGRGGASPIVAIGIEPGRVLPDTDARAIASIARI
jgi:hypothetical protein